MHTSLVSSLAYAFQIPLRTVQTTLRSTSAQPAAPFSSTPTAMAKKGRRKLRGPKPNPKITMIRYALYHPAKNLPRPLDFPRMRALRHWTIQRAWNLWSAKKRENQQLELERQWNAMRAACEELRLGAGDGGRLYRQAMSKKGVWGGRSDLGLIETREGSGEGGRVEKGREAGFPIEYGRGLTDYPPQDGWDESWTR